VQVLFYIENVVQIKTERPIEENRVFGDVRVSPIHWLSLGWDKKCDDVGMGG
jgi:hypothetical protein